MEYISNSFSLSMLQGIVPCSISVREINVGEVKNKNLTSCVGHESTGKVLSQIFKREIPVNRVSLSLKKGDILVVAQVLERLQEGVVLNEEQVKQLLINGKIKFYKVEVL